jgi:deazaflavin-dependent oxidoreductase (nitroreductase family)
MRSAGKDKSNTSVIRHVGRRTGVAYETPVVAVEHEDSSLIALPYGQRTGWTKNVLANGHATIVNKGETYVVDRPQIIAMTEVTTYFRPKEQKLHKRFAADTCLRVHRSAS